MAVHDERRTATCSSCGQLNYIGIRYAGPLEREEANCFSCKTVVDEERCGIIFARASEVSREAFFVKLSGGG